MLIPIFFIVVLGVPIIQCVPFDSSRLFDGDKAALLTLQKSFYTACSDCLQYGQPWDMNSDPCADWLGVWCSQIGARSTVIGLWAPPFYFSNATIVLSTVQRLKNLTMLDLSKFTFFPHGESFSYQVYRDFPDGIANMTMLIDLYLSGNNIVNVPSSLGKLHGLQTLHLGSNLITSLPDDLESLTSIQELDISLNYFTFALPSPVREMKLLQKLNISGNSFTSLPIWLSNLTNLRVLDIRSNAFSGTLPLFLENIELVYLSGSGFIHSEDCYILEYGTCMSQTSPPPSLPQPQTPPPKEASTSSSRRVLIGICVAVALLLLIIGTVAISRRFRSDQRRMNDGGRPLPPNPGSQGPVARSQYASDVVGEGILNRGSTVGVNSSSHVGGHGMDNTSSGVVPVFLLGQVIAVAEEQTSTARGSYRLNINETGA